MISILKKYKHYTGDFYSELLVCQHKTHLEVTIYRKYFYFPLLTYFAFEI